MGCSAPGLDLGEPLAQCDVRRGCPRGNGELAEDTVEVVGYSALAEHQVARDLAVGLPCGDQAQDFYFGPS